MSLKLENLQEGQVVKVKVLHIEDKKRTVNCKEGTCHKYNILFAEWNETDDKFEKCNIVFELLSKTYPQTDFKEGNVYWIKGDYPDIRGQRIHRTEPPAIRSLIDVATQATIQQPTQQRPPANNPGSQERKQPNSINISGSSVTFSMAYAKDLLCSKTESGQTFTFDEEIDYLERMSDAINSIMIKQVQK